MTYQTCGEISCEECNDRYEKALARIAALEQMVREFLEEDVDGRESCRLNRNGTPRKDCRCIQCRSLALLQREAGKEVGR